MRPEIQEEKKHHKYYSEDSEYRKKYFDKLFLSKVSAEDLGKIVDFESFKKALENAWKNDPSLNSYFKGMDDDELEEFFERTAVQNIIVKIEEGKDPTPKNIPAEVKQKNKKTINYYDGESGDKKVLVRKFFITNSKTGKRKAVYRDSKGKFAKRIY